MAEAPRGKFLEIPPVSWVRPGDRTVRLDGDLVYRSAVGTVWRIEAGFATDFASVPRWIPGLARYAFRGPLETAHAAILHDWLYHEGPPWVTRSAADALFWEALIASGESLWGARALWIGVRLGGAWAWSAGAATRPQ